MSTSMEKIFVVLKNIEQEKQLMNLSLILQTNQTPTSLGCILKTQAQPKGPQINLPNKFDGTCSKFQGFVNQMRLVI